MASTDSNKKQLIINRMSQATFDSLQERSDTEIYIIEDADNTATQDTAGMVRLYSTTGQNTDGTMTQKAITDAMASSALIPAGTVYTIPTDFEDLDTFCDFIEGKTASGTITLRYVKGTYTETEWFELPKCNVPSIIIDGNGSTFSLPSSGSTNWGFFCLYSSPDDIENQTNIIIENCNFVNNSINPAIMVYVQGEAYHVTVRICHFTNCLHENGAIFVVECNQPVMLVDNYFYLNNSNTVNLTNKEGSCIVAKLSGNVISKDNSFEVTANNTNANKISWITSTTCGRVMSRYDDVTMLDNDMIIFNAEKSSIIQACELTKVNGTNTSVDASSVCYLSSVTDNSTQT